MSWYNMSALILFILATTAAAYNDIPIDSEGEYEMDSWPPALETDMYWRRNLVLYKLLKQLQDDNRYDMANDLNIEQSWSQLPDLKEADEKKWVTALSSNTGKTTKVPKPRPQPKWKSKKGKGIPLLCYFKLCSFRAPV